MLVANVKLILNMDTLPILLLVILLDYCYFVIRPNSYTSLELWQISYSY